MCLCRFCFSAVVTDIIQSYYYNECFQETAPQWRQGEKKKRKTELPESHKYNGISSLDHTVATFVQCSMFNAITIMSHGIQYKNTNWLPLRFLFYVSIPSMMI